MPENVRWSAATVPRRAPDSVKTMDGSGDAWALTPPVRAAAAANTAARAAVTRTGLMAWTVRVMRWCLIRTQATPGLRRRAYPTADDTLRSTEASGSGCRPVLNRAAVTGSGRPAALRTPADTAPRLEHRQHHRDEQ